jgi:hypothetical protein
MIWDAEQGVAYFATVERTAQARAVSKIVPFAAIGMRSRMRLRKRVLLLSSSAMA